MHIGIKRAATVAILSGVALFGAGCINQQHAGVQKYLAGDYSGALAFPAQWDPKLGIHVT